MIDLRELRDLLAPGEPQNWQPHDGSGRPHHPFSWVEVEYLNGVTEKGCSAFFAWPWGRPGDCLNIVRWRFSKRRPTDRELAAYVPDLLAMLDARDTSSA